MFGLKKWFIGNRPGPPRPPGPPGPGPDDRCPKFNDWKNVTCWWPDTKFSDLPSECTYIYLPKKVPTAIQQVCILLNFKSFFYKLFFCLLKILNDQA